MLFMECFAKFRFGRLKLFRAELSLHTFGNNLAEIEKFASTVLELGILFKMGRVVTAMLLEDFSMERHSLLSFSQVCTPEDRVTICDGLSFDSFCCVGISFEFSFETNMFWSYHSDDSRIF